MEPIRYGLNGEPLSCCSLESDPVTGLSTPQVEISHADQVSATKVGVTWFVALFMGVVAYLVSQSNIIG